MQSNAFIITVSPDFKVTHSYKVKLEKSRFDSNVGMSCRKEMRARMKPSRDFCPQTSFAASVTSFTCLSTACVWQGNFGKMTAGVTFVVMRSPSSAFVIALITGGSEIGQSPVDHVEVFNGVEVLFCGNL